MMTLLERSTRRAQRRLNSRNDAPMRAARPVRDGGRDARQGGIRVAPKLPRHAGVRAVNASVRTPETRRSARVKRMSRRE